MRKAHIAVFSGTGNAMRASGLIRDELTAHGWEVAMVDLAAGATIPRTGRDELLILCTSILGFSPPSTVMERLREAPRSEGARFAMLCVCGGVISKGKLIKGWSGAAAMTVFSLLSRKEYVPVGSAEASYPENWTQLVEPATGEDRSFIIEAGDTEARDFAKTLVSARHTFIKRNLASRSVVRFIGLVFRAVARKLLARLYFADDSCSSCRLCASACPASAITMEKGKPAWNFRCSCCNRCINLCPSAAIQTSMARLILFGPVNLLALLVSIPVARSIADAAGLHLDGRGSGFGIFALSLGIYGIITALQLGPMDALIRKLERKQGLKPFFTAAYTRHFVRYLAPGFKPQLKHE